MGKTIHIHVHQTRDAGEWEESKHPRAENGQFGKGSGGGTPAKKSAPAKPKGSSKPLHVQRQEKLDAEKAAKANPHLHSHLGSGESSNRLTAANSGHQPGSHQYHQAKADEMRGLSRPYSSEHANLQLTTLHHHQNAATAIKRLETAQGTAHRRQLKEQADFHMKGAAEGEKQMQAAGLLKTKKPDAGAATGKKVFGSKPGGESVAVGKHASFKLTANRGGSVIEGKVVELFHEGSGSEDRGVVIQQKDGKQVTLFPYQIASIGGAESGKPVNAGSNGGSGTVINHQPSGTVVPHQAPVRSPQYTPMRQANRNAEAQGLREARHQTRAPQDPTRLKSVVREGAEATLQEALARIRARKK